MQTEVQNALKCLENKQTSYEKLSTWSQTYFNTTQQEVRKDSNVRTLINAAQPHGQQDSSHPMIDGDMNQGDIGTNVAANGRILSLNQNSTTMRTPQTRAASRPPYRKGNGDSIGLELTSNKKQLKISQTLSEFSVYVCFCS